MWGCRRRAEPWPVSGGVRGGTVTSSSPTSPFPPRTPSRPRPGRRRGEKGRNGVELGLLAELRPPAPGLSRGEGPRRSAGFPRGPPSAAAGLRFSPAGPYPLTWPWGRAAGWLLPPPVVPGRSPGRKGLGPGCCL